MARDLPKTRAQLADWLEDMVGAREHWADRGKIDLTVELQHIKDVVHFLQDEPTPFRGPAEAETPSSIPEPVLGLPVAGYQPQPKAAVSIVDDNKAIEERLLRRLDALADFKIRSGLATAGKVDGRWLSVARTHFEQGFMALNRAVFQPARLTEEDLARIDAQPDVLGPLS